VNAVASPESEENIEAPVVAICIPTYKRPVFLADLLESIQKMNIDGFKAELIVVDNDPTESGRDVVLEWQDKLPMPLTYACESSRGVASVRNRLVREAQTIAADYICFVDDDQIVEPDWLTLLVRTATEFSLESVKAQNPPKYEPGVPKWVVDSRYFADLSGDLVPTEC
jgi:succinoglycan biosynthesis protein ExoM